MNAGATIISGMGVSAADREAFVDRAAMLWSLYSAAGPFQGQPVPEDAGAFQKLLLQNIDVFKAAGPEGIQVVLDLQKATMDYDGFKRRARGVAELFPDRYER